MEEQVSAVNRGGKYLTFQLGSEQYGVGIATVKEIIGMVPVTGVPQSPPFVLGVVNLRGKVIPVVDLRRLFQLDTATHTERTCIIVVDQTAENGTVSRAGVVVDEVSEVLHINETSIEDAPELSQQASQHAIIGMAKEEKGVKILIDINKALQQSSRQTRE